MSTGLKFISSAIQHQAGNAILRIDSGLFTQEELSVYEYCKNYYRSYREVPTVAMVQENTSARIPRADGPINFWEDELHERFNYDIIRQGFTDLRGLVNQGKPQPMIDVMEDTIRRIRRTRRGGSGLLDIGEAMQLSIDRLEALQMQGGMSGVPTPWPTFNRISSGYQNADLITWVGRTSLGKTMILLAQAEFAYDAGYSVLFATTEMASEALARRWMALKFGYDPDALKSAQISTYTLRRMRAQQTELLGRERFRLLTLGLNGDLGQVEAAIEEIQPDILYLDGVYMVRPSGKAVMRNKTEQVSAVFDELKQRNIDTNIPFVVNTQFSRQAGKGGRDGSLESIGLSDTIGQHSSIVVAIKPGPTDNWHDSRELDFLKGREGEQGKVMINYRFKPTDISELSDEQLEACSNGAPTVGDDGEIYT